MLWTVALLLGTTTLWAQCLGVGGSTSSMRPEAMAQAAAAGVGYVEIGISGKGTPDEIREKALHAKQMADRAGLKVWSCHLPFSRQIDISVLDDSLRRANIEMERKITVSASGASPQ